MINCTKEIKVVIHLQSKTVIIGEEKYNLLQFIVIIDIKDIKITFNYL